MLNENLKALRKRKGFSQEVLAEKLHIVRQTVSKWEKGISVPDAEMLIRIADVLDTTVGTLLGDPVEDAMQEQTSLSQQLEVLNALMAERNRRSRRIWLVAKIILIGILAFFLIMILLTILSIATYSIDFETVSQIAEEVMESAAIIS